MRGALLVGLLACGADSTSPKDRPNESAAPGDSGSTEETGESASEETGDTSDPAPCARTGALVYGPTDLAGATMLEAIGMEVTVWDADQWTSATTEDFATFALIVVGEQSCDGPDQHGELVPLLDSRETWGAAVDGRVMVSGIDLQCHATDWDVAATGDETAPAQLHANAAAWLTGTCATSAMFATDWGRRNVEHLDVFGEWEELAGRGDLVNILEPDHPLFAGLDAESLNNWASTFHTWFVLWPDDFEVYATNIEDAPVILLRESQVE